MGARGSKEQIRNTSTYEGAMGTLVNAGVPGMKNIIEAERERARAGAGVTPINMLGNPVRVNTAGGTGLILGGNTGGNLAVNFPRTRTRKNNKNIGDTEKNIGLPPVISTDINDQNIKKENEYGLYPNKLQLPIYSIITSRNKLAPLSRLNIEKMDNILFMKISKHVLNYFSKYTLHLFMPNKEGVYSDEIIHNNFNKLFQLTKSQNPIVVQGIVSYEYSIFKIIDPIIFFYYLLEFNIRTKKIKSTYISEVNVDFERRSMKAEENTKYHQFQDLSIPFTNFFVAINEDIKLLNPMQNIDPNKQYSNKAYLSHMLNKLLNISNTVKNKIYQIMFILLIIISQGYDATIMNLDKIYLSLILEKSYKDVGSIILKSLGTFNSSETMSYFNINTITGEVNIEKYYAPLFYMDAEQNNSFYLHLHETFKNKKQRLDYLFNNYQAILLIRPVISFNVNIYKNDNKLPEINIKFELLHKYLLTGPSKSLSDIYISNEIARNTLTQSQKTPVKVIFMRHGYSCANLAKRLGFFKTGYLHNQYTDPELTATGIRYATLIKTDHEKSAGRYTNEFPDLGILFNSDIQNVCASVLMRTQQTAQYTFDPKKISIIPFVSEEGGFEENKPIQDQSVKKKIMDQADVYAKNTLQNTYSKLDNRLIQGIRDANIPNIHKFLRWLNDNYEKIRINPETNTIVIVSHKKFMQSLHQFITGKKVNINNYDMLEYEFGLTGDRHRKITYSFVRKIFEYPNTQFIANANRNNAVDICRKRTRGRRNHNTYTHTLKYNPKSLTKKRYGSNYRANNIKKYRNEIYENRPEFYNKSNITPVSDNKTHIIGPIHATIKSRNNYAKRGYTRKNPVIQTSTPTRTWTNWLFRRAPAPVPAPTPAPAPPTSGNTGNMGFYED